MRIIKRILDWLDDRTGLVGVVRHVMQHPVPPGAKWWYVFGSGTLLVFMLQVLTGIVLAAMYVPSPDLAYESLRFISTSAFLGNFVRGMHTWGATLMIVLVGAHMIQVFLFAAYKFPREMNWLSGVILLAVTLAMAFTGQILRWDANGVWTTVVLVNMAGRVPLIGPAVARFVLSGDVVSASTLSHFYTYHVFLIPAIIFAVVGLHLFLVIRNGISEPPEAGRPVEPGSYRAWYYAMLRREGVPFWPDSLWRDAVFGVVVVGVLAALAYFVGPPELTEPPSPANINANPRPDWYFVWLFAALALLPPGIEFVILIGGSLLFFGVLTLLPFYAGTGERSPSRRPWAVGIVAVGVTLVAALTAQGFRAPWSPYFAAQPLPAPSGDVTPDVTAGAQLFSEKGCIYCHAIDGDGGQRGPNLSAVGLRLTADQLTWRIANGGVNMPSYAATLSESELASLVAFLEARRDQVAQGD